MKSLDSGIAKTLKILLPKTPESVSTFNKVFDELLASYGKNVACTFDPELNMYTLAIMEGPYVAHFTTQLFDCGTDYGAWTFQYDGESGIRNCFLDLLKHALDSGVIITRPSHKYFELDSSTPMSSEDFAKKFEGIFSLLNLPNKTMEIRGIHAVYSLLQYNCTREAAMSYQKLIECILRRLDPSHKLGICGKISVARTLHNIAQHPTGRATLALVVAECAEVEQWPLWISHYLTVSTSQLDGALLYRVLIDLLKEAESMIVRPDYLETIKKTVKCV